MTTPRRLKGLAGAFVFTVGLIASGHSGMTWRDLVWMTTLLVAMELLRESTEKPKAESPPEKPTLERLAGRGVGMAGDPFNGTKAFTGDADQRRPPAPEVSELRRYLDRQIITPENIGDVRRMLFLPWSTPWNGLVRDETAKREGKAVPCAHFPVDPAGGSQTTCRHCGCLMHYAPELHRWVEWRKATQTAPALAPARKPKCVGIAHRVANLPFNPGGPTKTTCLDCGCTVQYHPEGNFWLEVAHEAPAGKPWIPTEGFAAISASPGGRGSSKSASRKRAPMPESRLARTRATLPAGYQFGQRRDPTPQGPPCQIGGHGGLHWAPRTATLPVRVVCGVCGMRMVYDVERKHWKGAGE